MAHKCSKCIYYYLEKYIKYDDIYNGLSDTYEKWAIKEDLRPTCGVGAAGVPLDDNRPPCGEYKG